MRRDVALVRAAAHHSGHQFPLIQQARDFFMPVGTVVNALVSWGLLDEATSTLLNRLNLFGKWLRHVTETGFQRATIPAFLLPR